MQLVRTTLVFLLTLSLASPTPPPDPDPEFSASVQPFLARRCVSCHNGKVNSGNLNIEALSQVDSLTKDREKWEQILLKLQTGEMPPAGAPRPAQADVDSVVQWIERTHEKADAAVKPSAGRVTARRLNRTEYNNTIRDLLGVDFQPAADFPQDDSGYGFDNIADALSVSPLLMEKYLYAAEKVAQEAIFGPEALKPTVVRHQPPYREGADGGDNSRFLASLPYTITDYDLTGLTLASALHTSHRFPADGEYVFRIDPEGNRPRPSEPFEVAVWIDGKKVTSTNFEASDNPTAMEGLDQEVKARVTAGEHWVAVSALKQYEGLPAKYGGLNPTSKPPLPEPKPRNIQPPKDATPEQLKQFEEFRKAARARRNRPPRITDVSFHVNFLEIMGPFEQQRAPSPVTHTKIFICAAGRARHTHTAQCSRRIVTNLARQAYRRPIKQPEVNRLLRLVSDSRKRGSSFDQSIAVALKAVLVSPHFLFRIEVDPKPGDRGDLEHRLSPHELAARLSYFLWSSMPDAELARKADNGSLRSPAVLQAQVRRMLKDEKASALVENFGGQWLQFRGLESVKPDPARFMAFDDYLRLSMRRETSMFFQDLVRNDGSLLDFLDANYSFLNEKLATFYGIKGIKGPEFRRVELPDAKRGGVLTHAGILTVSSYATRTSVVLRGKYVLENLLNAPVPPPPPDVPAIDEEAVGASMSLRQQMEKHRTNAVCASCHARMDPLGFGLENFDAIGRWRTRDGNFDIDASGKLPNGKTFNGPAELKQILLSSKDSFVAGLTEKMLTYALGRGLTAADKPAVKATAKRVAAREYRFSALVIEIVKSLQFQNRKGDRAVHVDPA